MDWIIFGLVVGWLGIISWFDIRTNEIPHSAWVDLPLIGAGVYRAWQGGWELVLLTVLVAGVSERERISQRLGWEEIGHMIPWYPWIFLGAFFSMQASPYAALAIIGFWVAWELKWWGGADAVAALTIFLIWPDVTFLLVFLVVHVIASIGLAIYSLIFDKKVKLHWIPGLPLLLLTVLPFQIIHLLS